MKKVLVLVAFVFLSAVAAAAQSQCETLTIVTETLPDFVLDDAAHTAIQADGGSGHYRFEIVAGVLPDGVHMSRGGKIRGVARQSVDNIIYVMVTDSEGCTVTKGFLVHVTSGP